MIREQVKLDLQRYKRLGMIEAIWGEHKSADQIVFILNTLEDAGELALVTRVSPEKAESVKRLCPAVKYHKTSLCLTLGEAYSISKDHGKVIILSGGTSDFQVASEAELALKIHGIKTELIVDVGVSGLHRLLSKLETINRARVLIACAGMEGALPTVLTGLVPAPVIGVPVSVGYGVSLNGRTALEGMLASCAPGLVVVNIDNGYGAAMAALRILNS